MYKFRKEEKEVAVSGMLWEEEPVCWEAVCDTLFFFVHIDNTPLLDHI